MLQFLFFVLMSFTDVPEFRKYYQVNSLQTSVLNSIYKLIEKLALADVLALVDREVLNVRRRVECRLGHR